MNAGMKMLMLSNVNKGKGREENRSERYGGRAEMNGGEMGQYESRSGRDNQSGYESRRGNNTRSEYYQGEQMRMGGYDTRYETRNGDYNMNYPRDEYEIEDRFRDRRGREHYDNGRYAPKSYAEHYPEGPSSYANTRPEPNRQRPIGFAAYAGEDPSRYESEATPPRMNEFSHSSGFVKMYGKAEGEEFPRMTRQTAEEWSSKMNNEDGTHGAHWTMDQTKQVMAQKNISADPIEFYLVMNMMYSDYCKVFKKHGVGDKIDFYVDMTKAFLDDKDAQPDKLSRYYECVVK